MQKYSEEEL